MTDSNTRGQKADPTDSTEIGPPGRTDSTAAWRLRFYAGELKHRSAWCSDFAVVENLYDQFRHDGAFSDIVIEGCDADTSAHERVTTTPSTDNNE